MKNIIITISRQYGSGGRLIGEKLAKILNINLIKFPKKFFITTPIIIIKL